MKHWKKYTVKTNCIDCKKEFMAYKYNLARNWGKYCSRACSKRESGKIFGTIPKTDAQKKKISETLKRKYASKEIISPLRKLGLIGRKGKDAMNWRGGKTLFGQMIRRSKKYKDWRLIILKRDDYTCQECGVRGGKLQVDHIKPFCDYPELIFENSNARALCFPCHRKTKTWGANKKRKEQEAIEFNQTLDDY